jgi:hypothetical protein
MKDIKKENLSMDRIQEVKNKIDELYAKKDEIMRDESLEWQEYVKIIMPLNDEISYYERLLLRIKRYNVNVGDGVTICYYTDREAGTIIKRTKNTITYQQDKAIRTDNNGMSDCQEYRYERDPNGKIEVYHWSNKYGCFRNSKNHLYVINGRHEYFDYSF